jgi:hypothetical protein
LNILISLDKIERYSMKKYVYCIPGGGFNDTLNQIERTWKNGIVFHITPNILNLFDNVNVYPTFLSGHVSSHEVVWKMHRNYVDIKTDLPVTFDFNKGYEEQVVVHHACGGGWHGIDCLERLKLTHSLAGEIMQALAGLGMDYDAIHIRNTDMRTNYMPFFKKLFPHVCGRKLLICSDDWACRETARRFFVESQVLTVTDIPDTAGGALHSFPATSVYEKNRTMLTDLLALAGAKRLFYTQTEQACISGFSSLAGALHKRPDIIANLLSAIKQAML